MKRFISALLITAIIVTMTSGCTEANGNSSKNSTSSVAITTVPDTSSSDEITTVTTEENKEISLIEESDTVANSDAAKATETSVQTTTEVTTAETTAPTGTESSEAATTSADTSATTVSTTATEAATTTTEAVAKVPYTEGSAHVYCEGTKLMVSGEELWINGVNTPWLFWNDFTGHFNTELWTETFKTLKEDRINCTRIWINCAGLSSLDLDKDGTLLEVTSGHWDDLDKLFALAEEYEIYLMPTLLSFDHFKAYNDGYDFFRAMVQDKEKCDIFAVEYAGELAKRYKDCEYLFAIDLMNEPDWVNENEECGRIDWEPLIYFFAKCAAEIHRNSDILVTVGMGMIKYNSYLYNGDMLSDKKFKDATGDELSYIDFYSTHYYLWEREWFGFPFDKSPEDFGLIENKPCLIGENSNDDAEECGMTLPQKYKGLYDNGWCGMMAWMEYRTNGTSGCEDSKWYRYDLTREATRYMYDCIPELIFPLGE